MAASTLVIAHRGALLEAPENTLPSFERALAAGADFLELDVRLTADGRLVVIHDDSLERTAGADGRVSETSFDALRRLDAGSWFGGEFAGTRIPALEEVAALAAGRAGLFVEVKDPGGDAKTIAPLLADALSGFPGALWVQSFDAAFIRYLKNAHASTSCVLLTRSPRGLGEAREAGADAVAVSLRSPAIVLAGRARSAGMKAFVWTVRSRGDLILALYWDVDGVITDRPSETKEALEQIESAEREHFGEGRPHDMKYLKWRRQAARRLESWPPVGNDQRS